MTSGSLRTAVGEPCAITRPEIERRDAVADAEHEVRVVLHQEHADAAVADDADDGAQMLDLGPRQAARRFVEQDELRPRGQGAGDLQEALRRMLQQIGAPVHDLRRGRHHAACRRRGRGCRPLRAADEVRRRRSPESRNARCANRPAWHCRAPAATARASASGRCARPRTRAVAHGLAGHILSGQDDRAFVDGVVARDQVQQRGLAAAVRPDQAVHLARPQLERDVVHRDQAAEALG